VPHFAASPEGELRYLSLMQNLEKKLQQWTQARLIDPAVAERILQFENQTDGRKWRWPAILAVGFGTLMLCAGVLLFVAAHWDQMSPAYRFSLVLAMVAVFHIAAGLLAPKVPMIGVALHTAGTIALGGGVYMAGQIFNLQEHWPGGIMLWALGAVIGWAVLRQWPQALLAAILIPWWLAGEWVLATEKYHSNWAIPSQGLLLLAILFLSAQHEKEEYRQLRVGMIWTGCLGFIPLIVAVLESSDGFLWGYYRPAIPTSLLLLGCLLAYVPPLVIAFIARRKQAVLMFVFAGWVAVLGIIGRTDRHWEHVWLYLWMALGATLLCVWGVNVHRKLFINYGSVLFALTVIGFYFSSVMDKLGRASGLILLGVIFLAGGWLLNRLRTDLIARTAAAGGTQ